MERKRSARTRGHTLQIELGAGHPSTQPLTTETHDRLERIYVLGGGVCGELGGVGRAFGGVGGGLGRVGRALGGGRTHRVPHAPPPGTVPT